MARLRRVFISSSSPVSFNNTSNFNIGVDYAFTGMMFGRIEYRYTDFGDKDFNFAGGGTINSDLDQHAIRVGLGVKS